MKEFNIAYSKVKNLEKNEGKNIINNNIAVKSVKKDSYHAIVLDGRKRCTTKELIKNGWNKNNIHIPNFSNDYRYIKRYHPNTYKLPLYDYLGIHKTKLSLVYLDYMCTFDGNSDVSPKEDIDRLFDLNLLIKHSILAITCSFRSKKKNTTPFSQIGLINTLSYIQYYAHKFGFFANLFKSCGVYKNGGIMYTLIWRLE